MAKCFGGGLKGHALSMHFTRNIKPSASQVRAAVDRGEDPLETVSFGEVKSSKGQTYLFLTIAHYTFSFCSYFLSLEAKHVLTFIFVFF